MKGEQHKLHHYIPQSYLKNFSSNEKSVWVYNKQKKDKKIYQQAVANICCKEDFYSLGGIYSDKLLIEKEFFANNIEPIFSNMLKDIIKKGSKYLDDKIAELILTPEEKYQFAYLLSIQWFRTPYQQHSINKLSQDIISQLIPILKEGMAMETGDEKYRTLDIKPNINPILEQAKMGYMNNELLDLFANALTANYWEFFITPKNYVYTSDFPITVKMHVPNARPTFEGLACLGSELTYPISKNICLTIWDRQFFRVKEVKDSYFTDMSDRDLIHFNTYRYAYANEVYCCENKFLELLQMYLIKGEELYGLKKKNKIQDIMQRINIPQAESRSADLIKENIEQLKQIFPEVIKEGQVDFEALNDLLGNYADIPQERFYLNWAGKTDARREAQKRSTGTLRPCPEESLDWDTTENLYIEGDNLEVLKLLQKSYHSRIKMIYIDPPYNTGKDFVYKDNYTDNIKNYLDLTGQNKKLSTNTESEGRYHSNWLNMMYPRLKLARNLLTDDGVIFISIDDNEVANLRKICDEIFGEENFVAELIWERAYAPKNDARNISNSHDYVLMYIKSPESFQIGRLSRTEEANARYSNPDNDPRGVWKPSDMSVKTYNSECDYPITTPSGRVVEPPTGRCWSLSKKAFLERLQDNRIWFGADENSIPSIKRFLSELKFDGMAPTSIMFYKDVGHSQEGAKEVTAILEAGVFDGPKPVRLLRRLLTLANTDKDSIILDFFSGSATTAHAVMQLNAEDGGNRKYICVQLPEPTPEDSEARKAGYNTIPEIAKERIRRAGKKILEEQKAKAEKEGGLFANGEKKLDIGFKVFKLDSSNINAWDNNPDNLETVLHNSLFNIKTDRSEEDLLYEILIKYGIELTQKINHHTIAGTTVYEMGTGSLIACLADNLTTDVAEGIGKLYEEVSPEGIASNCRVVFKDLGFNGSDEVKTNTLLILKQHGITNVASV